MAATATPIIIYGMYIAWGHASRVLKRSQPIFRRSMSMGVIHGGEPAFLRLKDYKEARANPTITVTAEEVLRSSLLKDHPDFLQLQSAVAKLEMTGREAEAVDILKKGYEQAQKKPHEAYEIDMLLVEMLIYKGDFKEALNRKCFKNEEISDARRPLYKATIHIMLEDKDEKAKECWEEFTLIRENSHCHWQCQSSLENNQLNNLISEFEEFKQLANLLKKDIQEVGQLISEFDEFKQLANLLRKDIQEVGQRKQRNDRLINIW
ncbi:transmembrane protein [Fagus crenata]